MNFFSFPQPDVIDTHLSDPYLPSLLFLSLKLSSIYTWSWWSWTTGHYFFALALQIQSTSLWIQIHFYLWANRIMVGEALLPYEQQQLSAKKSDREEEVDLESFMQIN